MTEPVKSDSGAPTRKSAEWKRAYIGLGSNIGDRERFLQEAVNGLAQHPDVQVTRASSIYETEPVGYAEQGPFLNMVTAVRTSLSPALLHQHMQQIENRLGRVRDIRNGPRTIDLDLLWMDHTSLDQPELMIPHPRMWERAFVLIPLADAAQEHAALLATIAGHLDRLDGKEGVIRWSSFKWRSESEHSAN